jgi:hypothetical protein
VDRAEIHERRKECPEGVPHPVSVVPAGCSSRG